MEYFIYNLYHIILRILYSAFTNYYRIHRIHSITTSYIPSNHLIGAKCPPFHLCSRDFAPLRINSIRKSSRPRTCHYIAIIRRVLKSDKKKGGGIEKQVGRYYNISSSEVVRLRDGRAATVASQMFPFGKSSDLVLGERIHRMHDIHDNKQ